MALAPSGGVLRGEISLCIKRNTEGFGMPKSKKQQLVDISAASAPSLWIGFNAVVILLLTLDILWSSRHTQAMSLRDAVKRTAFWVGLGIALNALLYQGVGAQAGQEFTACYLLEESLSVDNLFVFLLIFSYFKVPAAVQHRVLFLGVVGAIVMRGTLIFVGIELVSSFHFILYIFAVILIVSGLKMGSEGDDDVEPERNPLVRVMRKFMPVTSNYHGTSFFVWVQGVRHATPLFVVIVAIETTDLVFAMDSIPAVFGVTQDHFIAFSSNIMAILGLRALYFALAGLMGMFRFLRYGLSLILVALGVRMLAESWFSVSTPVMLAFIAAVLIVSIIASRLFPAPVKVTQIES
jgi:tellurite resistance protein TerC